MTIFSSGIADNKFFFFNNSRSLIGTQGTGGTIVLLGNEVIHTFTANGTFVVPAHVTEAWILAVAGGGGGGGVDAGGGGAGEFFESHGFTVTPSASLGVVIGAGGTGGTGWTTSTKGGDGGDTSIGALITVNGGGGGGSHEGTAGNDNGNNGGSGGGAAGDGSAPSIGGGTSVLLGPTGATPGRFGNAGGTVNSNNTFRAGGGGGGSNGVGQATPVGGGGNGGAERFSVITGTNTGYSGGGGGGARGDFTSVGTLGSGAGSTSAGRGGRGTVSPIAHDGTAARSTVTSAAAMHARVNSGGGGGGAGYTGGSSAQIGANGGSGIVVVRYELLSINIPIFTNNSTARQGGLRSGDLYRNAANPDNILVVHS